MKSKIAVVFLIMLIASCEKDIKVKVPAQPTRLVVNGIMSMNMPFRVSVSKTAGILDLTTPDSYRVTNALVQLYENGILKDTLLYNTANNTYVVKNNTRAQTGNTYLLRVTAPGFTVTEAQTIAPASIAIQSITRRANAKTDVDGNVLDEVKIAFNDAAGVNNYYLVRIQNPSYYNGSTVNYYSLYSCMHSSDKDIEKRNNTDPTDFESCLDADFLMQDKNFDGRLKEVILFIRHDDLLPFVNTGNNRSYRAVVELNSITAEHYKYRKSYDAYQDSEDNPFAEPVLVFTNIKNGYGVFSTYSLARDTIR